MTGLPLFVIIIIPYVVVNKRIYNLNYNLMNYYKQVLTFNFSDDEVRNEFEAFIKERKFKEMLDQSTYALPHTLFVSTLTMESIITWLDPWIKKGKIQKGDFVQMFVAAPKKSENKCIASMQETTKVF